MNLLFYNEFITKFISILILDSNMFDTFKNIEDVKNYCFANSYSEKARESFIQSWLKEKKSPNLNTCITTNNNYLHCPQSFSGGGTTIYSPG